ncbi:hypothetical protein [Neglectibacter caecimuris]|uniref:hypothetical protein n=1 Tax=Neglectibacter caecimuris TaxID=3093658 RepID=UPI002AC8D43F|nr:hypothetical protein [Neglectibacter sp. M00184]
MICPKCGRPIPDGSACSCTYVTPAFSNNPAVNALKASGASPLFLSAVILYTLTPLLSVVTALTGGGVSLVKTITESAAQSDPNLYFQQRGADASLSALFGVTVVFSIPSIVFLIGMWMHYAACRNRKTGNLSTAGLTVCKVMEIIQLVFECIVFAIYVIFIIAAMFLSAGASQGVFFNGQPAPSMDHGSVTALVVVMFVVLLIFIIAFFSLPVLFSICVIKVINRMKATASFGVPDNRIPMYLIVMLYLIGGFMALYSLMGMLLSLTLGLSLLTGAAAEILIAVCLGKYRKHMTVLMYLPVQPLYAPQSVMPAQGYPMQQAVIQPSAVPVENHTPAGFPVPMVTSASPEEKPEE